MNEKQQERAMSRQTEESSENKSVADFYARLISHLRNPEDEYCELTAVTPKQYRYAGYGVSKRSPLDPRRDDRIHGRPMRFMLGERLMTAGCREKVVPELMQIMDSDYEHCARVSLNEAGEPVVITHVESRRPGGTNPIVKALSNFCHGDRANATGIDFKLYTIGHVRLGGRTVLNTKDAVDLFHEVHVAQHDFLSRKNAAFNLSVRTVSFDHTSE